MVEYTDKEPLRGGGGGREGASVNMEKRAHLSMRSRYQKRKLNIK